MTSSPTTQPPAARAITARLRVGLAACLGCLLGACAGADQSAHSPAPLAVAGAQAAPMTQPASMPASGAGASGASVAGAQGPAAGAAGNGPATPLPIPAATAGGGAQAGSGGSGPAQPGASQGCPQHEVKAEARLHFHHVHFNSSDPSADIEWFVKFFDVKAVDFCVDAAAKPTRAARTNRGYLLFTHVDTPPVQGLDTYLEHVGWASQNSMMELRRQMMLGIKLWPAGDVRQCEGVTQGMVCDNNFYFLQEPNGARIEVSMRPGPSTSGFAHMHLNGDFPDFWPKVLGEALQTTAGTTHVDGVNLTNIGREMVLPSGSTESRGKPIDHLGFSTGDIEATRARIEAAGVKIEEPISLKPEYGFRSFMLKSPQGVWIEVLEEQPFAATP